MKFVIRILPAVHYRRMGAPADDSALLDRYAASRDEAAFHELVRRYVNLVYSAAARRVRDRHMAEDVTQAVFVILSRKVEAARRSGSLAVWLLRAVRYAEANAVKIERRRRRREAAAARRAEAAGACSPNPSDALAWQEVAAHLDDAVLALPAVDRCAIVLRFFEHKSIRDVADALNLTEAAAKQRLSRSVERLRQRLARRGIVAPAGAAGLSTLLATHAAAAAPAGVLTSACSVTTTVATGAASLTIAKGAITMMAWTKVKAAAAVLAVASVLGTGTVITLQRAQAQDGAPAAAGGGAGLAEKAAARVKAAEQVVEILTLREEANEPL